MITLATGKLGRIKNYLPSARSAMFTLVTLGDSITECRLGTSWANRWATRPARSLTDTYGGALLAEYPPVYSRPPRASRSPRR